MWRLVDLNLGQTGYISDTAGRLFLLIHILTSHVILGHMSQCQVTKPMTQKQWTLDYLLREVLINIIAVQINASQICLILKAEVKSFASGCVRHRSYGGL